MADAWRAGFSRGVVVLRPEIHEVIAGRLEEAVRDRMTIEFVRQELRDLSAGVHAKLARERPWGTAHAVWCARHAVTGSFVVANADDHYGPDAYLAMAGHLAEAGSTHSGPWALAGYPLRDVLSVHGGVNRGICAVSEDEWLEDVTEGKELRHDGDGVTGTWPKTALRERVRDWPGRWIPGAGLRLRPTGRNQRATCSCCAEPNRAQL